MPFEFPSGSSDDQFLVDVVQPFAAGTPPVAGTPAVRRIEKTTAFEVTWDNAGDHPKFSAENEAVGGSVDVHRGTYELEFDECPEGSQWSSGTEWGVVETTSALELDRLASQYGTLELSKWDTGAFKPKAAVELVLPNGKYTQLRSPPIRTGSDQSSLLRGVQSVPLKFASDAKLSPGKGLSVVLVDDFEVTALGPAKTLGEVIGVALVKTGDTKGSKTCTKYVDKKGKPAPDVELKLKETRLVVVDRRNSEELVNKVFPPDETCPDYVAVFGTSDTPGDTTTDSATPTKAIVRWLTAQVVGKTLAQLRDASSAEG